MKNDLIDVGLFGNDAGEDEVPEVLNSYFLEKPTFSTFFDTNTRLSFVRSKKGMGKSALLSELSYRLAKSHQDQIVIYVKASDLVSMQAIDASTPNALINGWQQRICSRVNLELGSVLDIAFSDDAIRLIEKSEVVGFRGRNLIGSLVDRLRIKIGGFEIGRSSVIDGNEKAILQRYANQRSGTVWLLVDDIDATFINTPESRFMVSAFFSACRYLVSSVGGLNIRASVRSDVWTILSQHDEALDKCDQYMIDIAWTTPETGLILGNKIRSYFMRKLGATFETPDETFNAVFENRFLWAGHMRRPHEPIHILAGGRPRWAAKLCRLAGNEAFRTGRDQIGMGQIKNSLREYGKARLGDLFKEHRHQCAQIELLVEAFAGGREELDTRSLLEKIETNFTAIYGSPVIDGNDGVVGAMGLAHFLFRIGFIDARNTQDRSGGLLQFVSFLDRPTLLTSASNPDDGLTWEIHPCYRVPLRIR